MLVACASAPPEIKAIVPPGYNELMASADEAQKNGGIVESMGFLERAAKADPSKKQPWLRISQAQFDARNYGSAITAAQEVLQRDNTDVTAKSIMAASGLRVSAVALDQLRQANALGGGTREEAQALARTMREALGESILPTAEASEPAPAAKPVRAARKPTPPVAQPSTAPATTPTPAAAQPKRNPFEALKG
jgi:hypothetical protein